MTARRLRSIMVLAVGAGGVPERFKGAVLKTVVAQVTASSNLAPSAIFSLLALNVSSLQSCRPGSEP